VTKKIKILLVDDHDVVRDGLKALLSAQQDFEIIGAADSGEEALIFLKGEDMPDVILMDITMKGMTGLETTKLIKTSYEDTKVLALTIHEGPDYFFAMLQAGASGYVPKHAASEDLIQAIRVVSAGDVYLHHSVSGALVQDFLQGYKPVREEDNGTNERRAVQDKLTAREREVLALIGEGLRNQDIAEKLEISPKTVSRHRENILKKLNLKTRSDLIRYALETGLID
jgi:two-component system, NarL family, response regulator NreC